MDELLDEFSCENDKYTINTIEASDKWIDEIIRDTEHYFQGEIQHDQRASWLLATNGLVIAIIVSFVVTALDNNYRLNEFLLIICIIFLLLSTIMSILVILPMRVTKPLWEDMTGKIYRQDVNTDIDKLIQMRFRHDKDWSDKSYETRIKYHFRSHYLRYTKKSRVILWASIFLVVGLIAALIMILGVYM